ncbi:ATP-binding protein [Clostridium estertheticum]|uniref:ATP-binding protein n=1 Tax=Clostridium estertheticum TaxID=238834 RepID=UPI001C0C07A2|nr:ATP-binding protein [Clostridium estertheticum]MBU3178380.1 ATP-binding protein [Clostridium estertheticum]
MEIYVVFTKIKLNQLESLEKKGMITSIKSNFKIAFDVLDDIDVHLCEGELQLGNADVSIIIKANLNVLDISQKLLEFKEKIGKTIVKAIPSDVNYGENISVKIDNKFEIKMLTSNSIKADSTNTGEQEFDYQKRSEMYIPQEPAYSFDRVILPKEVLEKIEESLSILEYEDKVFKEWGLSVIQPHPSSALSFYGPSGTGKTMAAQAIAQKLGKKILKVSYADIESKFHGEGPKMVKAIFLAAEKGRAVLFIDEADSLLSKRLTNVTQGSEQAINSMRSQLLICLEEFKGIVIFATNLVVNYDQAFLTRLISVKFIEPDAECREKIWKVHIYPSEEKNTKKLNIPLQEDVNIKQLAEKYQFCGREIRTAVISACVRTAMDKRDYVTQDDFVKASEKIVKERENLKNVKDNTTSRLDLLKVEKIIKPSSEAQEILKESMKQQFREQKQQEN